jgi:hypothetical protein
MLGVSEKAGAGGKEMLTAMMVGYEKELTRLLRQR